MSCAVNSLFITTFAVGVFVNSKITWTSCLCNNSWTDVLIWLQALELVNDSLWIVLLGRLLIHKFTKKTLDAPSSPPLAVFISATVQSSQVIKLGSAQFICKINKIAKTDGANQECLASAQFSAARVAELIRRLLTWWFLWQVSETWHAVITSEAVWCHKTGGWVVY